MDWVRRQFPVVLVSVLSCIAAAVAAGKPAVVVVAAAAVVVAAYGYSLAASGCLVSASG